MNGYDFFFDGMTLQLSHIVDTINPKGNNFAMGKKTNAAADLKLTDSPGYNMSTACSFFCSWVQEVWLKLNLSYGEFSYPQYNASPHLHTKLKGCKKLWQEFDSYTWCQSKVMNLKSFIRNTYCCAARVKADSHNISGCSYQQWLVPITVSSTNLTWYISEPISHFYKVFLATLYTWATFDIKCCKHKRNLFSTVNWNKPCTVLIRRVIDWVPWTGDRTTCTCNVFWAIIWKWIELRLMSSMHLLINRPVIFQCCKSKL